MYKEDKSQDSNETDKTDNLTKRGQLFKNLKRFFYEATTASASLNQTNSLDELLRKL